MLDILSDKLQQVFKRLGKTGRLSKEQVEEGLREIRLVLLEADVNYKVVKDFIEEIKERATGSEVLESLTPAQAVIKIVYEEMTKLLGGTPSRISLTGKPPVIFMLQGLQGSGKTTACVKLAVYFKKQEKNILMIAADLARPAAVEQLKVMGQENGIDVFFKEETDVLELVEKGIEFAASERYDLAIVDTAGRTHIDDQLMEELSAIRKKVYPQQVFMVLDAMMGQDSVNTAVEFQKKAGYDGIILTKLDGDARGGAALSVAKVTGKPIRFTSIGEKPEAFDLFYPDRLASRILGMGDVIGLIEKAGQLSDEKKAKELEEKIRKEQLNLEDFLDQMKEMKKIGPVKEILKMLPSGLGGNTAQMAVSDEQLKRTEAIIYSMTLEERRNPNIINGKRKVRIANGSGTTVQEVNQLLRQFGEAKKLMKKMTSGRKGSMGRGWFS